MPRGDITKKMKKGGAAFPDLSGDGKVTQKIFDRQSKLKSLVVVVSF